MEFSATRMAGLFVLIALLLLLRFPDPFTRQVTFYVEAGTVYFQDSFNLPFWRTVLLPYNGYCSVVPRLLAGPVLWLPYEAAPFAYTALSWLSTAAIFAFFYLPHFRHVVPLDWQRAAMCVSLCAASDAESLLRLETLHFYLAFLLVLLALMELPESPGGKAALALIAVLIAWSAPSAAVLAPLFLYRLLRPDTTASQRLVWGAVLAGLATFLLFTARIGRPTHARTEDLAAIFLHAMAYRIAAVCTAGERVANHLLRSRGASALLPFLAILAVLAVLGPFLAARSGRSRYPAVALLWSITASVLLFCALRPEFSADYRRLDPAVNYRMHDRYFCLGALLFLLYLGLLWSYVRGRFPRALEWAAIAWCAAMFLFGYPLAGWWRNAPRFADYTPAIRLAQQSAAADGKLHKLYIPIVPRGWFMTLYAGQRGHPDAREVVLSSDIRFTDYFDVVVGPVGRTGRKRSLWFGDFDDSAYPWIDHKVYGRMLLVDTTGGGYYFWTPQLGRFWTSSYAFPRITRGSQWTQLTPPAVVP